jgi:hypothetical protein
MSIFVGNLRLDFGDWGKAGRIAILLGVVTWISTDAKYPMLVNIRDEYMSDGASVPWFLWWFLPPWGDRSTFAALLHDYLLDRLQGWEPGGPVTGAETRELCDRQYLIASLALSVAPWRAYLAWLGVRAHSIHLALTGATDRPIGDQT